MSIRLGPILYAAPSDGLAEKTWKFFVQVLVDGPENDHPPAIDVVADDDAEVAIGEPLLVADFRDEASVSVWKWPIAAIRGDAERVVYYRLEGQDARWSAEPGRSNAFGPVAIPAAGRLPRLALISCNGFGKQGDEGLGRHVEDPELLWRVMSERHEQGLAQGHVDDPSGFHLLVGAGDQIYADSLDVVQELDQLSRREVRRKRPSAARRQRALREYLELYCRMWDKAEVRTMMSRLPGIFTWDDHDVMDGWGSLPDWVQKSDAYQDVYSSARRAFLALQLASDPNEVKSPPLAPAAARRSDKHLLQALSIREEEQWLDLVVLDLRSHRQRDRVLSDEQWRDLKGFFERYAEEARGHAGPKHFLLVSSIPLVYLRFSSANFILGGIPGSQGIEDDLLDQWEHSRHQGERDRLLMTLLDLRREADAQVTILSGDVHVASRGRVRSIRPEHLRQTEHGAPEREARIDQIVSSAIAHPPPGRIEHWAIETLGSHGPFEVASGVESELLHFDTQFRRLPCRNFAALAVDPAPRGGALWVEWIAEDGLKRQQAVIEP